MIILYTIFCYSTSERILKIECSVLFFGHIYIAERLLIFVTSKKVVNVLKQIAGTTRQLP